MEMTYSAFIIVFLRRIVEMLKTIPDNLNPFARNVSKYKRPGLVPGRKYLWD